MHFAICVPHTILKRREVRWRGEGEEKNGKEKGNVTEKLVLRTGEILELEPRQ